MSQRLLTAAVSLLGWAALPLASGAVDPATPMPEQVRFFETRVRPVLAEHCYRCHGPDKRRGGLRLDSRALLLQGGDTGPAAVPGRPDKSLLVAAINHGDLKMP